MDRRLPPGMMPPGMGPPGARLASPSTISKDATRGHAGEEMQILSDLAQRARTAQSFMHSSGDGGGNPMPPPDMGLPPPEALNPPPTNLPPPGGMPPGVPPLPGVKDKKDDEDSGDEDLDNLIHSGPFLPGTRVSYQIAAAQRNVTPAVPRNWKPTWSSAFETAALQETNGLRPGMTTSTVAQDSRSVQGLANDAFGLPSNGNLGHREVQGMSPALAASMQPKPNGYQNGFQDGGQNDLSTSSYTHGLAQTVRARLNQDLLGNTDQSAIFSFLLDNIEKLEWMNIALNEKLAQASAAAEESLYTPAEDLDSESEPPEPALCMQTLHQVFCTNPGHNHNGALYADQPKFREIQSRGSNRPTKKLEGSERITEVERYLRSRAELSFVVFKGHVCEDQRDAAGNWYPMRLYCSCRACTQIDLAKRNKSFSLRTEQLRIVSPLLKKALRELGKCRMDGFVDGLEGDPHMSAPYLFLYHHRAEIAEKLKEEETEETEHLRLLKDWLDTNYGKDHDEADELFKKGMVSEAHLAKLFKPNQVIIQKRSNGDAAAYAAHWWPYWKDGELTIQVWSWDFDGFDLTRKKEQLVLTYDTHKDVVITDLDAFPMEYAPQELLDRLLERGRKYWSMSSGHFASYSGLDNLREESYQGNRFMIDIKTHARMHESSGDLSWMRQTPGCAITDSAEFDTWPKKVSVSEDLKDEVAMLLPDTVPGFEMESKKWVTLNIMQTEKVAWNKKAFNRLVLDQQSKELIRALVSVHLGTKTTGDIIAGKGNGLIILLHGSPGVGKTLTAESVAELAEKPLYRVTCGDIGNKPDEVEKYLRMVLYLGKIWDCVLLMDEADVFLEERTMADLQRNSLVSVFLRILESYDGILILTSNRVGTFDEAFKSRIQVALHYKPLNRKSRKQIWRNFFEMIEEEDDDIDVDNFESRLDDLAAEEMNGRQIRNCLQTAQQLSRFKGEPLSWSSLSQALKTASDFQRYLKNIHGHDDETWAREEQLR